MTAVGIQARQARIGQGPNRFAPFHKWDRNFFLLLLAAVWAGILAGFIQDIFEHFTGRHVPYALIVHVHAAVFVGWMVLLTTQMSLIRAGRADVHRRLGVIALVMVPAMVVLGPTATIVMGHLEFPTPDGDAAFIIVPFLGMVSFASVAAAGLAFRKDSAAHRRLMLLATIFISDAGFARWLAGPITKVTGKGVLPFFVQNYFAEVILVGALIAFDLITRRKLHPAVAAAIVFGFANEVVASIVYNLPAWTPIATRIIGR